MTPLQSSILKTLSYSDVFNHPMKAEEIFLTLSTNGVAEESVRNELSNLAESGILNTHQTYYFLPTKTKDIVADRMARETRARKMLKQAQWVARFIRLFPFVRGIFLTGNLSKNVADKNSDIDFLIITESDRLWICRFFLIMFKKIFLLSSNKYFCVNYFIARNNLYIDKQNIYTAFETATVKVLWNDTLFHEFCAANQWIFEYVPNWQYRDASAFCLAQGPPVFQKTLEKLLVGLPLAFLDRWLMKRWEIYWKIRYSHLTEAQRRERFKTSSDVSASFGEDHHNRILREYEKRIERFANAPSLFESMKSEQNI